MEKVKYYNLKEHQNAIHPNEYIYVVVDKFGYSNIDFSKQFETTKSKNNKNLFYKIFDYFKNKFLNKNEKRKLICSSQYRDDLIENILKIVPDGVYFNVRCLGYGPDGDFNGYDYGCVENTYKLIPVYLDVENQNNTNKTVANIDELNIFADYLISMLPEALKSRIEKHDILYSGLAKGLPGLQAYGDGEKFSTFQEAFNDALEKNKLFGLNLKETLNLHGNKKRFGLEIHKKVNPAAIYIIESKNK